MKDPVITAKNISIGYPRTTKRGKTELYSGLSFGLYSGELTCLLGPNGAGKSTLLRTLGAVQPALQGEIFLNGKELSVYSESELSRLIGLVLTDKTSVGGLTVLQLVALGRYPYTGFFGKLSAGDNRIIEKAMLDTGIIHKSGMYVSELSDGERQKAMIAKALAQECPVLFLDEPTAFLDVTSRIDIIDLLHTLAISQKKTILLSTHDIELTLMLADRIWLLSRNNGLKAGVTEDIVLSDQMNVFTNENNIVFDKESGGFYPIRAYDRYVFIKPDDITYKWTSNFFNRNGWGVTGDPAKAVFSVGKGDENTILITENGQKRVFDSYEGIINWLNERYAH